MSSRLLRPGIRLLEIYSHQAKTRPLTTMSITTGISMGLGSWTCQLIKLNSTKSNEPIDFRQIFDYACFGAFITGPVLRYWWPALDLKIFKNKSTFLRPVKMMIVDIATFRFSIIAAFIFYVSLTQHKPVKECCEDLKKVRITIKYLYIFVLLNLNNFI